MHYICSQVEVCQNCNIGLTFSLSCTFTLHIEHTSSLRLLCSSFGTEMNFYAPVGAFFLCADLSDESSHLSELA